MTSRAAFEARLGPRQLWADHRVRVPVNNSPSATAEAEDHGRRRTSAPCAEAAGMRTRRGALAAACHLLASLRPRARRPLSRRCREGRSKARRLSLASATMTAAVGWHFARGPHLRPNRALPCLSTCSACVISCQGVAARASVSMSCTRATSAPSSRFSTIRSVGAGAADRGRPGRRRRSRVRRYRGPATRGTRPCRRGCGS